MADEYRAFARDLGKIQANALKDVDAVLKKGAQNIKEELIADVLESPHFKGIAKSISYDSAARIGMLRYQVGPERYRGGAIANIYYFGSSRPGGGDGDLEKPLRNEEPRLAKAMDEVVGKWASLE